MRIGCLLGAKLDLVEETEHARNPARVADILSAKTGINENQALGGLDQQAMTYDMSMDEAVAMTIEQPTTPRAAGTAIEVVDFHIALTFAVAASRLRQ